MVGQVSQDLGNPNIALVCGFWNISSVICSDWLSWLPKSCLSYPDYTVCYGNRACRVEQVVRRSGRTGTCLPAQNPLTIKVLVVPASESLCEQFQFQTAHASALVLAYRLGTHSQGIGDFDRAMTLKVSFQYAPPARRQLGQADMK